MKVKTEQENFWQKKFGDNYSKRNLKRNNRILSIGRELITNKIQLSSAIELGCNVGYNLDALKKIYPNIQTYGVEINKKAYLICKKKHPCSNASLLEFISKKKFDLVFTYGVLIHQNPKFLKKIYSKLYNLSKKYIYIEEYFNPTPVSIRYRGNDERLFKRDFAKEIWQLYPKLKIIDYGFHWKEDPYLKDNCDNNNWFLFKK